MDNSMQLDLKPCVNAIPDHPSPQIGRIHSRHDWTQKDRMAARRQLMSSDDIACPCIIHTIRDHELYLIIRPQPRQIVHIHGSRLAATRAFDIHDRCNMVGDH